MKFVNYVLSVSALAVSAIASINPAKAANEPAYNPSSAMDVDGIVTAVHYVPAGQPLEGEHLTVKNKTGTFDVYLGPADFLKMLKTNFPVGDEIDVMGSRVKFNNADLILAREVTERTATLTLRDLYGAPVWQNWGVEVDPSTIH